MKNMETNEYHKETLLLLPIPPRQSVHDTWVHQHRILAVSVMETASALVSASGRVRTGCSIGNLVLLDVLRQCQRKSNRGLFFISPSLNPTASRTAGHGVLPQLIEAGDKT